MYLKSIEKLSRYYVDNKYTCKCGARVFIPMIEEKVLCRHCGNWVFKNEKDEFNYRLKEKLRRFNV